MHSGSSKDEYFGTPERIATMRRGAALWSLLSADPRYAFYGRLVALSDPGDDTADILAALAALQGAAPCYFFPKQQVASLFSELQARGLSTDRFEHFLGGESAYSASKAALSAFHMPGDITVRRLDSEMPPEFVAEVAALFESSDVMPVPGSVLRGERLRGLCLVATDADGKAVSAASAIFLHHPESPHARTVFWGMLSTLPERRGQKIALLLGARAIVHMWEVEGARGFMTGVRQDNASSVALCNKLGVTDTDWTYAVCMDTQLLGRSTVTK